LSDSTKAFVVVLDEDLSEESSKAAVEALKHFRGVIDVTPHISDINDLIAESRARHKLAMKLYQWLKEWK
jgi:hypothetical protein